MQFFLFNLLPDARGMHPLARTPTSQLRAMYPISTPPELLKEDFFQAALPLRADRARHSSAMETKERKP
jgi:hypothetical protein